MQLVYASASARTTLRGCHPEQEGVSVPERVGRSALRWLIGVELARYRSQAGLTLSALAEKTGISKQKLGHLETAERNQSAADIATVLTACGATQHDVHHVESLVHLDDTTHWWDTWSDVVPEWLRTFIGLEALASSEFLFEPIFLPGLLQTEAYARALLARALRVRPDHAERVVQFRMARAHRLFEAVSPLQLRAVVNEQALRLQVGSREVLAEQYGHLLAAAQRPNITIQVVRPDAGPHPAGAGQFVLFKFSAARPLAYIELQDYAIYHTDPPRVEAYASSAEVLAENVALSPAESQAFIRKVADEVK